MASITQYRNCIILITEVKRKELTSYALYESLVGKSVITAVQDLCLPRPLHTRSHRGSNFTCKVTRYR